MAILSRDDFFSRIQGRIGEDTSDEAISFVEDMTDTFNDMEQRANGDGVDWEQRYHELDESWKKKYSHRFFSAGGISNIGNEPQTAGTTDDDRSAEKITFKDLFS